jgi:hypothetical protein
LSLNSYQSVNREQLAKDITAIHKQSLAETSIEDFKHLKKMERWGKACSFIGYASAWIIPNPISALLISQGSFTRWTQVGHPVIHRALDKVDGVQENYTSKKFAQGWRRFIDWPDWFTMPGWHYEHDILHHYSLGEKADPNNAQHNMKWLRESNLPMWQRYIIVAFFSAIWKIVYYTPRTHQELRLNSARQKGEPKPKMTRRGAWSLFTEQGRGLWLKSILPYTAYRFVLLPLLFLPLGSFAVFNVLINSLLAEVFTNMHSFLVMIPNHAGDDVMMFDEKSDSKGVLFTANFRLSKLPNRF